MWNTNQDDFYTIDYATPMNNKSISLNQPQRRADDNLLRIVQITDPHLGCMFTPERLHKLCSIIVDTIKPDFVFLTGDFFTCESNNEPEALVRGLSPLKRMNYSEDHTLRRTSSETTSNFQNVNLEKRSLQHCPRVFACYGNHDLESESVRRQTVAGVKSCGAVLLDDERMVVPSRIGFIEIVGLGYYKKQTVVKRHMASFFAKRQREIALEETVRNVAGSFSVSEPHLKRPVIVMLHDPMAFVHLPPDLGALVLSGHTHGGHFGLCSIHKSLQHATMIRALGHFDNGVWTAHYQTNEENENGAHKSTGRKMFKSMIRFITRRHTSAGANVQSTNVLYVHRGQGSRGMLSNSFIRLGVPSEDSVLHVHVHKQRSSTT